MYVHFWHITFSHTRLPDDPSEIGCISLADCVCSLDLCKVPILWCSMLHHLNRVHVDIPFEP